jgi:hypothetical protein
LVRLGSSSLTPTSELGSLSLLFNCSSKGWDGTGVAVVVAVAVATLSGVPVSSNLM